MTVEFLQFWGTPQDSEEALRRWLHERIYETTANDLNTLVGSTRSPLSDIGLAIARQSFKFELSQPATRDHWHPPDFLRSVDDVRRERQRQANHANMMETLLLENGEVEPGRRIDPFVDWPSVASRARHAPN
jgi:hypothetical protein